MRRPLIQLLPSISGTAADTAPGQVAQVKVAYRDLSNNNWWDPVAKTVPFTLPTVGGGPPAAAFISTTVISGAWNLTGASTPTWISGTTYEIFAQGVDAAGNQTPFPGSGSATVLPASPSSYVQFLYQEPPPQSALTAPVVGSYFKSSALTSISGTAANADTVKIKITYYGPDGTKGTADDLVWNGTTFVSTTAFPSGYVAVSNYNAITGIWSSTFTAANWQSAQGVGNTGEYDFTSLAIQSGVNEASPPSPRQFFVDDTAPTGQIQQPNALYLNTLATISGTSADTAPGQVNLVQVEISTSAGAYFWTGSSWTSTEYRFTATQTDGSTWNNWYFTNVPPWVNGVALFRRACGSPTKRGTRSTRVPTLPSKPRCRSPPLRCPVSQRRFGRCR